VLAIDTSRESLILAKENAEALGLRERVKFRQGNWLEGFDRQADVIVSNPPYLTEDEWLVAEPEVRDYEPKIALVSEDAGMQDLKYIIQSSFSCLVEKGILALEMGIAQGDALSAFAKQVGYSEVKVRKDLHGRDRFMELRK
jgi:release factor glutamine methyltransferase